MSNNKKVGKFISATISLHALCKLAKVNYFTIYRRRLGIYKSDMPLPVRTNVANALVKDINPFLGDLGFEVILKPLKDQSK